MFQLVQFYIFVLVIFHTECVALSGNLVRDSLDTLCSSPEYNAFSALCCKPPLSEVHNISLSCPVLHVTWVSAHTGEGAGDCDMLESPDDTPPGAHSHTGQGGGHSSDETPADKPDSIRIKNITIPLFLKCFSPVWADCHTAPALC